MLIDLLGTQAFQSIKIRFQRVYNWICYVLTNFNVNEVIKIIKKVILSDFKLKFF